MFLRLCLLFTCTPLVELALLLQIGSIIGALNTIVLVIFTGMLGAYLARQQGLRTFQTIRLLMARGEMPGEPLVDALMIFLAGLLLITPGILTDLLGFLMLVPATRAPLRRWIRRQLEWRLSAVNTTRHYREPE